MKVCISRNAEARTNAALARVSQALYDEVDRVFILSRNRYPEDKGGIIKKKYDIDGEAIDNYEINIRSKPGKGIINIFQLIHFQIVTLIWFLKNSEKYDVIHAFDLDVGLPALLIAKLKNKKYVYHIADFYVDSRGTMPNQLKAFIRKIEFMVINNAASTIVCTEDRIKQIAGSKPKKIVVVHNTPISSQEFWKNRKEKSMGMLIKDKITFTYVGGLSKGRFIQSAMNVIKDYPQLVLNLAGMGTSVEHVKNMSDQYTNINYHGMIDYGEAINLYAETDFMFALYDPVIPNYKFSAPNKVYEAMLLGKPIIIAKNTGIDRIVTENKMGYVIEYSEEAFRVLIDKILTRSMDWEERGENAKRAYPKYSWPIMKNRIIELYRNIDLK